MKRFFINILLIAAIIAGGLGLAMLGTALRTPSTDALVSTETPPINVRVAVLEEKRIEDTLALMGVLEPWEDVTLSAETQGKIDWQGIDEGDEVRAGQELLKIDTKGIHVRLNQALAQQKLARQELKRNEEMRAGGISSPQDMERAQADNEVALANVHAAQLELAASVIASRFDGVIDTLHKREGEYVSAGTPLLRLVAVDRIKLLVGVPERDVPYFSRGHRVKVRLDAFPAEHFEGTIYRVAITAEESTRTFATEIELDNAEGRLKPGMIARARLVRRSFPNAITIPLFSVITSEDGQYAFVEEDGVARRRPIEVGFMQGEAVHITHGLVQGNRLIVVGQRDLRDGDLVRVTGVAE